MDSLPLISVIVPVYKVEKYLDRCVESIVHQTYQNLEIVLVDDGSPDRCPEMCDEWAEKDSRIKVIHKSNGGLSDARNAGMEIASGTYIGFIDSDDWIASEMYQKLMTAIQKDRSDIAACSVEMIWEDDRPSRMLTQQINCVLDKNQAQLALLKEAELKQPVWYKLYRRKTINGILFENGKYHEDVFWSYQAIGNADRVSIIDYVGYYYWQRSGSIMGEKYSLKRLDAVEATVNWCSYVEEKFPEFAGFAQGKLIGCCMYHNQFLLKNKTIDPDGRNQKRLQSCAESTGIQWKNNTLIPQKQKMWIRGYLCVPNAVCLIRNFCRIGL